MDKPILRLGLLGFGPSECQKVLQAVEQPSGSSPHAYWELVEFEHADAWCINGASIEQIKGNTVLVRTLQSSQPLISLDPAQITRPVAFTEPLPQGLEAAELVNFNTPQLLLVGLQRFEAWLRPIRVHFAMGKELIARESELSKGVYHVIDQHGSLLAVVNLIQWTVALLPSARPADFEEASWMHRPNSAADAPPAFVTTGVAKLMWAYASRTSEDVLPARYRKQTIYLRKLPKLPVGWMRDEHLVLLRALSTGACKFEDLLQITELPDQMLARALAALYYAGSITSKKASASQPDRVQSPTGQQSSLPPDSGMFVRDMPDRGGPVSIPGASYANKPAYLNKQIDATAPAPLFDFKHR
jgi:hypothetical protein